MSKNEIYSTIADYYSEKILKHGLTPRGVDWNGEDGQALRFDQLIKIISNNGLPFTITDLGCGYGALFEYLQKSIGATVGYHGLDISAEMINAAKEKYKNDNNAQFTKTAIPLNITDYIVASGIFNVRLQTKEVDWLDYIQTTLINMNKFSSKGFSFNCLTSYSDENRKRNDLYYADPCHLFNFCKKNFSKQVALLHDYGLYEFTILVRK